MAACLARGRGNLSRVEERVLDLGGVPTRLYESGSDHLLLYGHRGTLSKDHDRSVLLCRKFADETGLTVVSIDAPHHGARRPRSGDPANDRRLMEEAVVTGGEQTAADWKAVVEALGLGPAVAYVGFSLGAMHGTIAAAAIPTLRAAVFGMAGVPVFALDSVRETGSDTPHMAAARRLRDCEVLMVNTTDDDMFPRTRLLRCSMPFPVDTSASCCGKAITSPSQPR